MAGGATGACVNGATGLTSSFGALRSIATDGTNIFSISGDCAGLIRKTVISTGATTTLTTVSGANYLALIGTSLYITTGSTVWKAGTGNHPAPAQFATLGATGYAITSDTPTTTATALYVAEDTGTIRQLQKILISGPTVTTVASAQADLGLTAVVGLGGYVYDGAASGSLVRGYSMADGTWTNVAGSGAGGLADGTGTDAWFSGLTGLTTDGTSLLGADSGNSRVRKIAGGSALPSSQPSGATAALAVAPGAVSTTAGNGTNATADNATGLQGSFRDMGGAVSVGSTVYVGTVGAVRTVSTSSGNAVGTLAGNASLTGCVDAATGSAAHFGTIADVATDTYYAYVSDASCGIRRVSLATGATSTLTASYGGARLTFGNGQVYATSGSTVVPIDRINGTAGAAVAFSGTVSAIAADASSLYAVVTVAGANQLVSAPLAGGAMTTLSTDGVGTTALASSQSYVYDAAGSVVRRYSKANGAWTYVAGTNTAGYADGTGASAGFNGVAGLVSDGASLWVADSGNHRLRNVVQGATVPPAASAAVNISLGAMTTFAGSGSGTESDGTGTSAGLPLTGGIATWGSTGYFRTNGTLRKVDLTTGQVTLLAGAFGQVGCVASATPSQVRFGNGMSPVATDGYYVYSADTACATIYRTSIATGATDQFAQVSGLTAMTLGPDSALYYSSNTLIYRLPVGGGTPTAFVALSHFIESLTADDAQLWATEDYSCGSPCQVKLARVTVPGAAVTEYNATPNFAGTGGLVATRDDVYGASAGNTGLVRFPKSNPDNATVITGQGPLFATQGGYLDGTGPDAWSGMVAGIASDGASLFVSDRTNGRLRKVVPGTYAGSQAPGATAPFAASPGQVTTLAGSGQAVNANGPAATAGFADLKGAVVVGGGAYFGSGTAIRRLDLSTGQVSTLAGSLTATGTVDSTDPAQVRFDAIYDLTTDGVAVYTATGTRVRRTSIATGATVTLYQDTSGILQRVTFGPQQKLYALRGEQDSCCSNYQSYIMKIDPSSGSAQQLLYLSSGMLYGLAADDTYLWATRGPNNCTLNRIDPTTGALTPIGSSDGAVSARLTSTRDYLYEAAGTYIRRISKADGSWTKIAGTSASGYVDATGTDAWFGSTEGIASDGSALYVDDLGNHRVRKVVPGSALPAAIPSGATTTVSIDNGKVSTFAGNGTTAQTAGTGTAAGVSSQAVVTVGGYAYVGGTSAIRKVNLATGEATTLAGSLTTSGNVNSLDPTAVRFSNIYDLATDGTYVYSVSDSSISVRDVRRTSLATGATSLVRADGLKLTHLTFGKGGFLYVVASQENSFLYNPYFAVLKVDPVSGARSYLIAPTDGASMYGIAADATSVYVAKTGPSILRVDPDTGAQTTLVSTSSSSRYQALASAGNYLYASFGPVDSATQVSRIDKTTGAVSAVAGSTTAGYNDGLAGAASFSNATGIVSDGNGLWVADQGNWRLRRIGAAPLGGPVTVTEAPTGTNLCWPCVSQFIQSLGDLTLYPVSTASGNFFHTFDDLSIPGRGPAVGISRTYNSAAAFSSVDGPFGYGWSWSYGVSLTAGGSTATVVQEDGSQVAFNLVGGVWQSATGRTVATLAHNGDGTWTFLRHAQSTLTFDSSGRLAGITDLNGYTTTVSYPNGSTEVVTDPAGRAVTLTFTGAHVTSMADGASPARTVSYSYDGSGNLTDVVDVGGGHTTFTYDGAHRMLTMRSPRYYGDLVTTPSPVVTNHYDASGRVDWQSDPLGRTTTFDYTSVPGSTKVTDPKGNVVLNTFTDGLLTSITKGYGTSLAATWKFFYDPASAVLTEVVDPLGHVSNQYVDGAADVRSRVDPLGRVTKTDYNALHEPVLVTDAAGVATTIAYDSAGNITSKSAPLLGADGVTVVGTSTTTFGYGGTTPVYAGDVTSVTDPTNRTWSYRYDSHGNLVRTVAPATPENAAGNATTYTYDGPTGWLLSSVSPRGNVTGANPADFTSTFVHDAFGRVVEARDPMWSSSTPAAHRTVKHYDADGELDSVTDGNGNLTSTTYDAAGEPTSVARADATTVATDYWPDGSLKTQYDGMSRATSYAYDSLGRLSSVTDPLGRATSYGYDPAGSLVSVQDPGGNCSATPKVGCTTRTYDAAGQLLTVSYSDGTTPGVSGLQYDAVGRRTHMTDGTGSSVWAYDSLGRLVTSTNGASATLGYQYDLAGRLTVLSYPGGSSSVTRAYDGAGRLSSVTDWASRSAAFGYDANSDLVSTSFPNGDSASISVDRSGSSSSSVLSGASGALASLTYGRDGAGQLSSQSGTGAASSQPTEAYGYTALEQLSTVNGSAAFSYDAADNLTRLRGATQAFDVANELTSSTPDGGSATSFGYDDRGDRVSMTPPAGGGAAVGYGWDQARRLVSAGPSGSAASYAYDGDGERMSKTVGGSSTAFAWDVSGGLPLAVRDGSASVVYGPGGLPLEQVASDGTALWFFHDQLGSTRALTDSTGAVVATWSYDPYGAVIASTGTAGVTHFGFAGEYTDAETGFVYLRARYYDPATGQFLSRDPLVTVTRSAYGYVWGDTLNRTDPSGFEGQGPPSSEEYLHAQNGGPLTLEEALDLARRAGVDTTGIDFEEAETDYPGFMGLTDFVDSSTPLIVNGRYQILITNNALSCPEQAIKTIAHEVDHINQFLRGEAQSEAAAEEAAEAAWQSYLDGAGGEVAALTDEALNGIGEVFNAAQDFFEEWGGFL